MADAIYPNYPRQNSMAGVYSDIAIDAYYNARELHQKIIMSNYNCENMSDFSSMEKQVIITVVFSAMCIEAFFNDYAASCLGDKEFYKNFDKLSTISKFQLIVKFILKTEIDKSKAYYSRLKQLVRNRDNYVHSKSLYADLPKISQEDCAEYEEYINVSEDTIIDFFWEKEYVDNILKEALDALKTIRDIAKFFDSHDSEVNAFSRLLNPVGGIFQNPHKSVVFQDLGIKVDM